MIVDHLDRRVRSYPVTIGELLTLPLLNCICAALVAFALESMWFSWDLSAGGGAATMEYERTRFVMWGAFILAGLVQLVNWFFVFRIFKESGGRLRELW